MARSATGVSKGGNGAPVITNNNGSVFVLRYCGRRDRQERVPEQPDEHRNSGHCDVAKRAVQRLN
ncbi:MAG: hypothetical protein JO299_18180 [Gammaproteobacteria bacterium]|nr:hypothetical protein [Gammaproteobacteria bacterium]